MMAHGILRGSWIRLTLLAVGVSLAGQRPARGGTAQALAGLKLVPTTRQAPDAFGTQSETVTTIAATSFTPQSDWIAGGYPAYYTDLNSMSRYSDINLDMKYYHGLSIPAGAVIDYIGLETANDTDGVLGVALYQTVLNGVKTLITGLSSTVHNWGVDFNASPIGFQLSSNAGNQLVLEVENAPNANYQYFGWVEVWWHRTVSPAPASASFVDVPTTSPIFPFVEALKASGITAGCDATHYCPNNALTRGQMAVFLATALGLHWPN